MSVTTGDIGKQIRLHYADGSTRAVGRMIAHTIVPAVVIEDADGNRDTWRHDMADVIEEETPKWEATDTHASDLIWTLPEPPPREFRIQEPAGAWIVYTHDNGVRVQSIHATEVEALRVINDQGYGRVDHCDWGQEISEAVR